MTLSRRDIGIGFGAALAGTAGGSVFAIAQGQAKVVIIGGGPGGATVARRLKEGEPRLDVTLIEASKVYTTCFFSNLYLGGFRTYASLQHGYEGLSGLGVKVVHALANDVDTTAKVVRAGGRSYPYDRLVVAPGIDIKYDSLPGYSRAAAQVMPHAYLPGAQTQLLKRQLDAMRNGGTVLMVMPENPYRCPPGPYERACMIAHYLKTRKPRSKLVILDPKKAFSKQPVFVEAFGRYYKDIVELNLTSEIDNFAVEAIDVKRKTVKAKSGKTVRADVANIIPQQRAGAIAHKIGLAQGDWCPVEAESFASPKVKDVYVLGDAAIADAMPKSAFSANSQARVVANDILAAVAGKRKFPASFRNTCWSMVAPDDSVKIGANYQPKGQKLDASDNFVSKPGEPASLRKMNFEESVGWYDGIVADAFPKAQKKA